MSWKISCSILLLLVLALSEQSKAQTPKEQSQAAEQPANVMTATASSPDSSVGSVKGTDAEAARDYELGPGDLIHVSVWHEQELTQTAVVRPDGKISLPLAGEIPVAGKTAVEAQLLVSSKLLRFITDPQVTVSVLEIHSRQVFITGQVQRPGSYPLTGSVSVLQLIASAGGLTQYAHRKGIVILDTKNQAMAKFDYTNTIKGKVKDERPLQPGDTVVVP
jgi:polysaccharide export outer membrane protein